MKLSIILKVYKFDADFPAGDFSHVQAIHDLRDTAVADIRQARDACSHLLHRDVPQTIQGELILPSLMAFLEFFPTAARARVISSRLFHLNTR
jgi:hypothetical protein